MSLTLEHLRVSEELWGSQSWLQPAFSRLWIDTTIYFWPKRAASKAAAGKIARPTRQVEYKNRKCK